MIYVTYGCCLHDGAPSRSLRYLSLISYISKFSNVKYVHTPLDYEYFGYSFDDSCTNRTWLKDRNAYIGWEPEYTFEELMYEMCDHWLDVLQGKKSNR